MVRNMKNNGSEEIIPTYTNSVIFKVLFLLVENGFNYFMQSASFAISWYLMKHNSKKKSNHQYSNYTPCIY